VHVAESEGDCVTRWEFRHLPARPMMRKEIAVEGLNAQRLESAIQAIVADVPHDAVLSIRVSGVLTDAHWRVLSATRLRQYVPETMNVDIRPDGRFGSGPHAAPPVNEPPPRDDQLSLQWATF
jgi:hypothetical protein